MLHYDSFRSFHNDYPSNTSWCGLCENPHPPPLSFIRAAVFCHVRKCVTMWPHEVWTLYLRLFCGDNEFVSVHNCVIIFKYSFKHVYHGRGGILVEKCYVLTCPVAVPTRKTAWKPKS